MARKSYGLRWAWINAWGCIVVDDDPAASRRQVDGVAQGRPVIRVEIIAAPKPKRRKAAP